MGIGRRMETEDKTAVRVDDAQDGIRYTGPGIKMGKRMETEG
jgi:hypothetical protein